MKIFGKREYLALVLLILTVVAYFSLTAYPPKKFPNTNIILITCDALRADHLGCYGYTRNTSPRLDKLRSEGIMFTQAISQGASTIPSLPSLMTSLYPYQHGIVVNSLGSTIKDPLLAQILKNNGYATCAIVANEIAHTGIAQGFDQAYFSYTMNAAAVTEKAIDWLQTQKDAKTFLWLHYFDTHGPYTSPSPYTTLYLHDTLSSNGTQVPLSTEYKSPFRSVNKIPFYVQEKGMTNPDYYRAKYDGAIRYTDEQIGILLSAIERLGLEDKTMIILSADHGEYMGEHNIYFTHGHALYEQVMRVPLIIKYKNVFPAGKTFDHIVGHIDLMPTILNLVGIRAHGKAAGIDLCPFLLRGKRYPKRAVFTELWDDSGSQVRGVIPAFIAIRTDTWKLIEDTRRGTCWLFNLKNDPRESHNLAESNEVQCSIMRYKLNAYFRRVSRAIVRSTYPVEQGVRNKLKSLGYLQ